MRIENILMMILCIFLIYVFIWIGVVAVTQSHCLEKGYPKSEVTYKLGGYCMNMTGSVTVKVDKQ